MLLKFKPHRVLFRVLPITCWIREYTTELVVADIVAGITVAITLIPQSIAYASLAGLEAQYGLYSSFVGSFVYIFFGTIPEINIGPTALLSLLTFTYTHHTNPDFAVMLCFLGGLIQLAIGFARLGFLVDFVSIPVVSGFTSSTSVIIICAQFKNMLGLSFNAENFISTWKGLVKNIHNVRPGDAVLSAICCTVLLAMKQLGNLKLKPNKSLGILTKGQEIVKKFLWFTSVGRNAAVVILSTVAAYLLSVNEVNVLKLSGHIVSGFPSFQIPNFSTTLHNSTVSFGEITSHIGSGVIVVPLIGIIANVAIAKAFSKGTVLDANQEIVALGLCNFFSSFAQSIPVNGSFSRSAVSNASGVKTPAAGLYTGAIVLLTLGFLTPYFFFIPKAALASVIVCAVLFMIDLEIISSLWKNSKQDLIPLFGTFFACLFTGVELGILIGIAIDIALLLYYNARPRLNIRIVNISPDKQYTMVTPSGGLFFPSANYVRSKVTKAGCQAKPREDVPTINNIAVVIDCSYLHRSDWTCLQGIKAILQDFKKLDQTIIFLRCRPFIKRKLETEAQFVFCADEEDLKNYLHLNDSSANDGTVKAIANSPAHNGSTINAPDTTAAI